MASTSWQGVCAKSVRSFVAPWFTSPPPQGNCTKTCQEHFGRERLDDRLRKSQAKRAFDAIALTPGLAAREARQRRARVRSGQGAAEQHHHPTIHVVLTIAIDPQ